MLLVGEKNALLEASLATLQALCSFIVILRDLQQLLKEHDYQFNHLFMLLRALLFLEDFIYMHNESFDYFWRQEVLFVCVELTEKVNLDLVVTFLIWQLCQLTEEHQAQERHLLVLVVENMQGQ